MGEMFEQHDGGIAIPEAEVGMQPNAAIDLSAESDQAADPSMNRHGLPQVVTPGQKDPFLSGCLTSRGNVNILAECQS